MLDNRDSGSYRGFRWIDSVAIDILCSTKQCISQFRNFPSFRESILQRVGGGVYNTAISYLPYGVCFIIVQYSTSVSYEISPSVVL